MLSRLVALGVVILTAGCTPRFVESTSEVDVYLARQNYAAVCVALNAESGELRKYAAEKLAMFKSQRTASDCLCARLYRPELGKWDAAVAEGLGGSGRDDLANCLAKALEDRGVDERERLVRLVGNIKAGSGYEHVANVMDDTTEDVAVRAAAAGSLKGSERHTMRLASVLATDEQPAVRAEAARALRGNHDSSVIDTMVHAARDDADGTVRAAAMAGLVGARLEEGDKMMCDAMLEDPSPEVRVAAINAFKGTDRIVPLGCLIKRLKTQDDEGAVRLATLEAIGASPSPRAARALCDTIGPYVRMYVIDRHVDYIEGANIVEAQNNRDHENSYECVRKALGEGGYSCYGRSHLARWFEALGGQAHVPKCPKSGKK